MPPVSEIATILAINFTFCLVSFVILWRIGCAIKDVTFVDAWWALGLASMAVLTFIQADAGATDRKLLLLTLAVAWGLRLGLHILWRWRSHGPDRRYVKMLSRAEEKGWSYPKAAWRLVFRLQAPILWVVSLPVQLGQLSSNPASIGAVGMTGAALAAFGILFESLADVQLTRFKANPANAGKVFDQGLWRYTRHPNYFGDLCVWFGLWLVAAETTLGIAAILGPLLLLVMFVKYSGGPSYEKRLTYQRPGYADYIARTSSLVPWPPRRV